MAKPYREAPLIGADATAGMPILNERTDKSVDLLRRMTERFDDEFILLVAAEVGLEECLSYGANEGALDYDLTGLQLVALSAALAACAEYREATAKPSLSYFCRACRNSFKSRRERGACPKCGSERIRQRG